MISATPLKFAIWPNTPVKLLDRWTISACFSLLGESTLMAL
jgi:hypothetical protein